MDSIEFLNDNSHVIETELNDILTVDSCTTLVSELIKFILYRKQQLPYTFDRLKYLITKRNSREQENPNVLSSVERQFKVAESGLETLELLFEKTKEELSNSNKGFVSEIALLFGSTPMTPKQVYIIHLPEVCLGHSSVNHPERKHLFHLLQSVILSNNLTNMLKKPMNLTNMYVFIKKNFNSLAECSLNNWFTPKHRFQIPRVGQHFHIKFRNSNYQIAKCNCKGLEVYNDTHHSHLQDYTEEKSNNYNTNKTEDSFETEWFQACTIFKGFSDVYLNGVSVADLWLR